MFMAPGAVIVVEVIVLVLSGLEIDLWYVPIDVKGPRGTLISTPFSIMGQLHIAWPFFQRKDIR